MMEVAREPEEKVSMTHSNPGSSICNVRLGLISALTAGSQGAASTHMHKHTHTLSHLLSYLHCHFLSTGRHREKKTQNSKALACHSAALHANLTLGEVQCIPLAEPQCQDTKRSMHS